MYCVDTFVSYCCMLESHPYSLTDECTFPSAAHGSTHWAQVSGRRSQGIAYTALRQYAHLSSSSAWPRGLRGLSDRRGYASGGMRAQCDVAACHAVATPGHLDAPQSATAAAPSLGAPAGAPLCVPVERGRNKCYAHWEESGEAKGEGRGMWDYSAGIRIEMKGR